MKMRKFMAALFSVAAISNVAADGRDGLVHWWKVKDLNGDGLLQAGEVYDVMTVGAEKPLVGSLVYQSEDIDAGARPVAITTDINMPTMRKSVSDGAIRLYSPTNYTADGKLQINHQSIQLPKEATLGTMEATVAVRIKWDGARFKASNGTYNYALVNIYANNFNDNAGSIAGWLVGLRCLDGGTPNYFAPMFSYGNKEFGFHPNHTENTYHRIYQDRWYDIVYSFRREDLPGQTNIYASVLYRGETDKSHTYVESTLHKYVKPVNWNNSGMAAYYSHIGFHTGSGGAGGRYDFIDAARDDSFPGEIHEIKVYNRRMSEREMLQCLGTEDPICSVGSKNGSADEFSDSLAAEIYEPETMPWSMMRKTLNAQNPSASIKCNIESYERDMPRLMEIKLLKGSAFAGDALRLDMNGLKIGRLNIPSDGTVRFFIPASKFEKLGVDDQSGKCPVVFTLTRKGAMEGDVCFDAINIDGAWQLGAADKKYDGFASSEGTYYLNYTYHVGQKDIGKLRASLMGEKEPGKTGYRDLNLHFAVGDYLAENCDFKLTVKTLAKNTVPLGLYLNDLTDPYDSIPIHGLELSKTWLIPAGTFSGGGNWLRLRNLEQGQGVWINFDSFRLEPVIPEGWRNSDEGFTIKVR